MTHDTDRRLLQVAVALASIVPLSAGAMGVLQGPAMLEGISGIASPDLESHFRYLSGLLLAIGLAFVVAIPSIERRSELFVVLSAVVVVGGLARLSGLIGATLPTTAHQLALVMELVVVPLLLAWQLRIARLYRS